MSENSSYDELNFIDNVIKQFMATRQSKRKDEAESIE